jgi:3'-phosphoadenosine 5'-phosphosulfate sulfotransferase (PAPS reductase)/FAD synthetase
LIALHFSGGKDSLACLYLNRHRLHEIVVMWVDSGKNFPCVLETIWRAKAMCQHWVTVSSDQDANIQEHGWPSDVVPIDSTRVGEMFVKRRGTTLQSYLGCCAENIWIPLWRKTKELGCTEVIRGQRADEGHTAPVTDGMVVDGAVIRLPLEHWTADEVLAYLRDQMGELPEHLLLSHSSMDCHDCTAYWPALADRRAFVEKHYPEMAHQQQLRMQLVKDEINHYVSTL